MKCYALCYGCLEFVEGKMVPAEFQVEALARDYAMKIGEHRC